MQCDKQTIRLLLSRTVLFPPVIKKEPHFDDRLEVFAQKNILDLIKMLNIPLIAQVLLTDLLDFKSQ